MSQLSTDRDFQVEKERLYRAIVDFANYPEFLNEVVSAKILSHSKEAAKVKFELEIMKRFSYVLEFHMKEPDRVTWTLVESDLFKKNSGSWVLESKGTGCHAKYSLDVDFGFMIPGFVSRKLTEVSLPKMFKNFEEHAKTL